MKKSLFVVFALIITLGLTGASCFQKDDGTSSSDDKTSTIQTLKDAFSSSLQLKCTYTSDEFDGESTVYISPDGKFKSEYKSADGNFTSLYDKENYYTWSDQTLEGAKFNEECLSDLETSTGETPIDTDNIVSMDDLDQDINANCSVATGEDFTPPSDISFTDYCELMQNLTNTLNQFNF